MHIRILGMPRKVVILNTLVKSIQTETQREKKKRWNRIRNEQMQRCNLYIMGIPEGEETEMGRRNI